MFTLVTPLSIPQPLDVIQANMSEFKEDKQNPFHRLRKNLRKNKRHATDPAGDDDQRAKRTNTEVGNTSKSNTIEPAIGAEEDMVDEALIEIATTVGDCVTAQKETVGALNDHSDKITESEREIQSLKIKNKQLTKRLDNIDAAFKSALERITNVEKTANTNMHILKNSNIVVEGVPETPGENCMELVCDIFREVENKCQPEDVITAYRIGQKPTNDAYTRPIVVKMMDPLVKLVIMENKGKLFKHERYSKVFLNDDLPPKMKNERKVLREICKYAHLVGHKGCKVSGGKLVVDGKSYRYETIHLLPQELQMCNVKTRLVGDGLGFQGEESYLSNFFPATFTMEQLSFSCAEQAFQFFKARTCKREDKVNKIMGMSNPRDIKATGDDIQSLATWELHKEAFMRAVVFSKFNQNEEIRRKLIDTGNIPLYECTRNRWWGSGLRLDSPEWQSGTCPGLNKLGLILSDVRSALRKITYPEDANQKSPGQIIQVIKALDTGQRNYGSPGIC